MTQNRREFIGTTTAAAAAMFLSSLDALAVTQAQPGFQLKVMGTDWGYGGTIDELCAAVKKEGYDGLELWWPGEQEKADRIFAALKKHGLAVGFLCGGSQPDFNTHLDSFKKSIDAAAHNKTQRPLYINCHSGRDYFSFEQNQAFLEHTHALSKSTGIKICHESHRSRMLFAAPVARHYIEKDPALRMTLDVSHWCNVSESLLQDQSETMDMVLPRVDHIHARIGHPQGPQVNDPRAPEWERAVKAHFAWWDKIVEMKKQQGEVLTVLTEFGPPDYMPVTPYTRKPLADQWAINVYMMQTLRKRYQ
jgi:sugar phosphate isomerase/epimerase